MEIRKICVTASIFAAGIAAVAAADRLMPAVFFPCLAWEVFAIIAQFIPTKKRRRRHETVLRVRTANRR
jgi:hypothetical protein